MRRPIDSSALGVITVGRHIMPMMIKKIPNPFLLSFCILMALIRNRLTAREDSNFIRRRLYQMKKIHSTPFISDRMLSSRMIFRIGSVRQ